MPILIVNNDPLFLVELQKAFEAQGYKVIAVTNSLLTASLFLQHKPQAIVLDIFMRDKDGFEVTKEIRSFCKKTFILAVATNELYLKAVRKLGANEALPKWIHADLIVDQFRKVLAS